MNYIFNRIVIGVIVVLIATINIEGAFSQQRIEMEKASLGKVSIKVDEFFQSSRKDFFLRRLPRFLHYSIDEGFWMMLKEVRVPPENVTFVNVLYNNKRLVPAPKNMAVIRSFYDRFITEGGAFLENFCRDVNGLDFVILWDPDVDVEKVGNKMYKVTAAIMAYDRNNNLIQFEQLEITYELMKEVRKLKELIAEYTKKFSLRLWINVSSQ